MILNTVSPTVHCDRNVSSPCGENLRNTTENQLAKICYVYCIDQDVVCEVCGGVGFKHLLVQCDNCKDSTRHRYCMDTIVYDGPSMEWLCDDCLPKHNEPMESLEAFSNEREQDHIQLDPSMNSLERLGLSLKAFSNQREQDRIQLDRFQNAAGSFKPTLKSMEWLDLSKKKDNCISTSNVLVGSIAQGMKTGLFPSINDVDRSHPSVIGSSPTIQSEQVDGSSSTLDGWKQPYPLEVIPNMPKSIQGCPSNYSQPVQGSYQNTGNGSLNASIMFLDSRLMSKAIEPSSFLNGQGSSTVEKDSADSTNCVLDKELIAPAFDNLKGSNLSVAKDCLVSNADNSDEVDISVKHLLGATDNREQGQSKLIPHRNIWRGEVICSALNERSNSRKINENSNPKSALMGNQQESNHQYSAEAVRPGILNNQYVNNYTQANKQKGIKVSDAGNTFLGDPNAGCAQNDTTELASQDVVAGHHCSVFRMPVISAPTDQQCYIPMQPIDKPCWTGIMKIGPEYISLTAHLSNKACKKVQELSRSLPPVMKVIEHPELKTWPSRWEELEPIAESIALYLFPDNTRPNKDLDRLMKYVTNHSIVLKYTVGLANLLIFHSVFLPEKFQMFQGKHFLWGVFKHEMVISSKEDPPVKKQDCTSQVVKKRKDQQDKVQVDTLDQKNPVTPVKKQDCTSQSAKEIKDQRDKMQVNTLDQEKPFPSVKKHDFTSQVAKKRKDQHEKVQVDTLDQEKPVYEHNIPNGNQPSPDTVNGVDFAQTLSMALTKPGDDGKAQSSSEAPAPKLFGLVDVQIPRSRGDLKRNLKELIRSNC